MPAVRPSSSAPGLALLALGALALVGPVRAQDPAAASVSSVKVTEGIWMLATGAAGNVGVSAGANGVFLVDDQIAPLAPKLRAAVDALGKGSVRFVLNTHWHGDHTGGNESLGKTGTVIVAHENVRKRLSVEQFVEDLQYRQPAMPGVALPVVTFTDAVTFHLNGDEIHVFHVPPAHTDGDAVVHFKKANVIHMGDTFFNKAYPFIDRSSGGSLDGVIATADRVLGLADASTKIIPGHGPLATRADLVAYRDLLVTVRDRLRAAIVAKQTLAEARAAKLTREWDAEWGTGFIKPDQFLEIAWKSLGGT